MIIFQNKYTYVLYKNRLKITELLFVFIEDKNLKFKLD